MIISFFPCPMLFSTLATNLCDEGRTIWTTLQNVLSFLTVNLDLFSITLPTMCVEVCNLMQMRDFWTFISFIHIIKDRKKYLHGLSFCRWNYGLQYIYTVYVFSIYTILPFHFRNPTWKVVFYRTELFRQQSFFSDWAPCQTIHSRAWQARGTLGGYLFFGQSPESTLSLDNRQVETSESQGGGGRWKPLM